MGLPPARTLSWPDGSGAGEALQHAADGQTDPGIAVALAGHAHERQPPEPVVFLMGDKLRAPSASHMFRPSTIAQQEEGDQSHH